MNKQELIDKAVHSLDGVYEKSICGGNDVENYLWSIGDDSYQRLNGSLGFCGDFVCTRDEFQQRSRELGYINGYRWGVEYPTNGEKPDLPDDVVVCIEKNHIQDSVDGWDWPLIESFRITDERYKPADTSYLSVSEIPESKSNAENVSDWWDYEAQKAVALPPVGIECLAEYDTTKNLWFRANIYYKNENCIVGRWLDGPKECRLFDYEFSWKSFRPLDHATRKAEAEKRRVVDAALPVFIEAYKTSSKEGLEALYDTGFLRMPAE